MKPYYDEDGITIYHGDCREVDAWLACDVLITDPPYGVDYRSGWDNKFRDVVIANDETLDARDCALNMWGNRPGLVFGSWKQPRPTPTRTVLTWDKGTVGMGDLSLPWFPCTEEIYVLGAGWVGSRSSAVLRCVGRNEYHPTEKPLPLLHSLISKCPPGVIADPFTGSGSILLAARNHGRSAVGIELEERYCEIAARRLQQGVLDFGEAG